mgnify:CR=1 FL=1
MPPISTCTALVTGAGRGLGRAIALALAQAGASLWLVSRTAAELDQTAQLARTYGVTVSTFTADIAQEADVRRLSEAVARTQRPVTILVNNAGIHLRKTITDIQMGEWNRIIAVNLTSIFLMTRAFVPGMKQERFGRIINMSSVTSLTAGPARSAYAATKSGILGLTRALALELGEWGITVNSVSPGTFATEMNAPLLNDPEIRQQFLSRIAVGRWGRPHEIGELVAYLCSEESGFLTGTDILIDGGWRAA